jgi:bacterioferritin-associated ferredoxin
MSSPQHDDHPADSNAGKHLAEHEMAVSRCICFDVSFDRLREIATSTGGGLLAAHKETGCGARCGLCLPYIQFMLRTGDTDLPVMWSEDFESAGISPGRLARLEKMLREAEEKEKSRSA